MCISCGSSVGTRAKAPVFKVEAMQQKRIYLEPSIRNALKFLKSGYSFRELFAKALAIKVYSRIVTCLKYPFYFRGAAVDIDHRAVIDGAKYISIDSNAFIQRGAWLTVPLFEIEDIESRPYILLGRNCRIGPNCQIAAANRVELGSFVLLGPNVLITDNSHVYENVEEPISCQGIESKGSIVIEDNCWLGANSIIYSARGPLRIGRNSVVAGNSFVRNDVPPYTVVAGSPAVPVRQYDFDMKKWVPINRA